MSYLFLQDPMPNRSKAPHGAFTLIEMLVVIGVIALLAAIMFPVFARVREGGRKTVCMSNLKQLGLAFQQYNQDYNGRYPAAGRYQMWANGAGWITGGDVAGGKPANDKPLADGTAPFATTKENQAYVEKGALFPYVKTASVYTCPSAPDVNFKKLSYSMNCALSGGTIARVRNPGELVLLVDEGDTINDGFFWATNSTSPLSTDALFQGHLGTGNLLFVDGHVKAYNTKAFVVDGTTDGLKDKWRGTGSPRFHDRALGPNGSAIPPVPGTTIDSCLTSLASPRNWTTDP